MDFRSVVLVTALCAAPAVALSAQQAQPSTEAAPAGEAPVSPAAPGMTAGAPLAPAPQPHASPLFQKGDPAPTLGASDRAAASSEGKNHTIVVSTLVLVLVGIIVLLLVL